MTAPPVALRPASDDDGEFLFALYASTRTDALAALGWDAPARDAFLRSQFRIQDRAYRHTFPGAAFDIVLVDAQPAGRLYVDRRPDCVHVIDIALMPGHQGRGIGSALLAELLEAARAAGQSVTLSAERGGRALGLYHRLGFELVREDEIYAHLRWCAS